MNESPGDQALPGLSRRLASMFYESLLVLAVVFIAALLFSALTRFDGAGALLPLFRVYVFAVMAGYFVCFWSNGRRTLAMKTWRLRLMRDDGQPLRPRQALLRYCLAWLSITGIALLWVLFDPERLFLHDRLAGTRLVLG